MNIVTSISYVFTGRSGIFFISIMASRIRFVLDLRPLTSLYTRYLIVGGNQTLIESRNTTLGFLRFCNSKVAAEP